jgi:hypothetical protein
MIPTVSGTPNYSQMAAYGQQGQFGAGLPTPGIQPSGTFTGGGLPTVTPTNPAITPFENLIYKTFNNPVGRAYVGASNALYAASNYLNSKGPLIPATQTPKTSGNQYNANPLDPNSLAGTSFSDPKNQAIAYLAAGQISALTPAQAESLGLTEALADPQSGWQIDPKTNAWTQQAGAAAGANDRTTDVFGNAWDKNTAKTDIYGGKFIQAGEVRWERVNGRLKRVQYGRNGEKKIMRNGRKGNARPTAKREKAQVTGEFGVVNFNTGSG